MILNCSARLLIMLKNFEQSKEPSTAEESSCGRKALLYLEPGRVTAECTEPAGHDGIHYDRIFSLGWRSKNDAQR